MSPPLTRGASWRTGNVAVWLLCCWSGCHSPNPDSCLPEGCPVPPGCEEEIPTLCGAANICAEQVCQGITWVCGKAGGQHAWLRDAAPCDDGDPCTTGDLCRAGGCRGTVLSCRTPPLSVCQDAVTLKVWSTGSCKNGTCFYPLTEVRCPERDCQVDRCLSDPCLGKKCDAPPTSCFAGPGHCAGGKCSYAPLGAGSPCTTSDPCLTSPICDGEGACTGTPLACDRPNATGGTCVAGVCQGWSCAAGWGDCNASWADGCETRLNTVASCGSCGRSCGAAPHATPSCEQGQCELLCHPPHADCNKIYTDGCEIPVGVTGTCNATSAPFSGEPCGTAYCGSPPPGAPDVKAFGSWYCAFCPHCHAFPGGYSWCLLPSKGGAGTYSPERCWNCCAPGDQDRVCPAS